MMTVTADPGSVVPGRPVRVNPADEHHLGVCRAEDGDQIRVLDGAGTIGWGPLSRSGEASITIERVERVEPPPPVLLAAGAGDRDRFLDLVEKAVELGVTQIVPIETLRSQSVSSRVRSKHVEKLVYRAQQAMKQSGNPWLPRIGQPMPLEAFLAGELPSVRWLADTAGHVPDRLGPAEGLAIAVGPEGGFAWPEQDQLLHAGFAPVTLGPYVLRFETAALAALTLACHLRSRTHHD
jgi:16S rRNA (uracil1498-N3)-methyltransferase